MLTFRPSSFMHSAERRNSCTSTTTTSIACPSVHQSALPSAVPERWLGTHRVMRVRASQDPLVLITLAVLLRVLSRHVTAYALHSARTPDNHRYAKVVHMAPRVRSPSTSRRTARSRRHQRGVVIGSRLCCPAVMTKCHASRQWPLGQPRAAATSTAGRTRGPLARLCGWTAESR